MVGIPPDDRVLTLRRKEVAGTVADGVLAGAHIGRDRKDTTTKPHKFNCQANNLDVKGKSWIENFWSQKRW
jgi:hypothetical protein